MYMAFKIRRHAMKSQIKINSLKVLTLLLATFLLIHGVYHFLEFVDASYSSDLAGFLSDSIVEPASWTFLALFSVYFSLHG